MRLHWARDANYVCMYTNTLSPSCFDSPMAYELNEHIYESEWKQKNLYIAKICNVNQKKLWLNQGTMKKIYNLSKSKIKINIEIYSKIVICHFQDSRFWFFFLLYPMRSIGGKYWNRSRGKLAFKGSSDKDYETHGLD